MKTKLAGIVREK